MRTLKNAVAVSALALSISTIAASVNDVGDADSFGRDVKYLGAKSAPTVFLRTDCSEIPAGSIDRCIVVNPNTAAVPLDQDNLLSIKIPGGSSRSLLCYSITTTISYQVVSSPTIKAQMLFMLDHTVAIESSALKASNIVDFNTGLPANGKLTFPLSAYYEERILDVNVNEGKRQTFSRDCVGGFINKQLLQAGYGLTSAQVAAFFASPITIRMGTTGRVARARSGNYSFGVRVYGD